MRPWTRAGEASGLRTLTFFLPIQRLKEELRESFVWHLYPEGKEVLRAMTKLIIVVWGY